MTGEGIPPNVVEGHLTQGYSWRVGGKKIPRLVSGIKGSRRGSSNGRVLIEVG